MNLTGQALRPIRAVLAPTNLTWLDKTRLPSEKGQVENVPTEGLNTLMIELLCKQQEKSTKLPQPAKTACSILDGGLLLTQLHQYLAAMLRVETRQQPTTCSSLGSTSVVRIAMKKWCVSQWEENHEAPVSKAPVGPVGRPLQM